MTSPSESRAEGHDAPAAADFPGLEATEAPDLPAITTTGTPSIEPLDVDGIRPVLVLTALWGVAAIVLVFLRTDLEDAERGWWLWTCVAGFGLGLLGFEYCRRRRDARQALGR